MRAIRIVAPGKIEYVEAPEPRIEPGKVMVRPLLLSLCGSDVHMLYYSSPEEYPMGVGTSGHEMIAQIEAVDAPGYDFKPGDIVLMLAPWQTAMCEHFVGPAEDVLPLPSDKPLEHFLMAQQLGTVIYALKRIPSVLGKDVVVQGQGSAGLFFAAMCRRMGAERVIGIDFMPARVAAGLTMGATHTINSHEQDALKEVERITDGRLADVVIEAVGEVDAINATAQFVRVGGQVLFFGVPRACEFHFDFWSLFRKYCYITSSGASAFEPGRKSFKMALDLIGSGAIDVCCMITHRFPFERVMEGYELAKTRDDGAIKVVIEMPAYAQYRP